jgi:ABC-type transport system involved in cytochrome bd biosynthesis fused ATPase/permease subunit
MTVMRDGLDASINLGAHSSFRHSINMVFNRSFVVLLLILLSSEAFQPSWLIPKPSHRTTDSALFAKKKKGGVGGSKPQEKQSVKDARFDAATRQFMFSLVGLTKILPDKSKKILDNIHLSFYPGAKIGIVGLNGSGKVNSNLEFFCDSYHPFHCYSLVCVCAISNPRVLCSKSWLA